MQNGDPVRSVRIQIDVPVGVEVETKFASQRYTTTQSVPDADQKNVATSGGKLPTAWVTFSGGVINVLAIVQLPATPLQTTPPGGVVPGAKDLSVPNKWVWTNTLPVAQTGGGLGAANKFVLYWQNAAGGDWEIQAWTFYAN